MVQKEEGGLKKREGGKGDFFGWVAGVGDVERGTEGLYLTNQECPGTLNWRGFHTLPWASLQLAAPLISD